MSRLTDFEQCVKIKEKQGKPEETVMPGVKEYIETNGMHSFCDLPFGDADNLLFCQIFYMPFERVVSESFSAPVPFPQACNDVFASRGYQHKKLGMMIPGRS